MPTRSAIGPFTPGVNILHAPNGTGKTTLFRSVGLGLLEGHRSKTAELQALRPWGCRLTPQVSLEFEHSGRGYRLRKRFLDTASSHLERRQGDSWTAFAQGDSADEFLRELLLSDSDRARFTKQESWGLAQVLWATQGELTSSEVCTQGDRIHPCFHRRANRRSGLGNRGKDRERIPEVFFPDPGQAEVRQGRRSSAKIRERTRQTGW